MVSLCNEKVDSPDFMSGLNFRRGMYEWLYYSFPTVLFINIDHSTSLRWFYLKIHGFSIEIRVK